MLTFTNLTVIVSWSWKIKQRIDRNSSSERSRRFVQSLREIEAVITISVASLYLLVSKEGSNSNLDEYK